MEREREVFRDTRTHTYRPREGKRENPRERVRDAIVCVVGGKGRGGGLD